MIIIYKQANHYNNYKKMTEKEEFAESPVPQHARLGFVNPALIWAGFAYAYICIFIGSQIMAGGGGPPSSGAVTVAAKFPFLVPGMVGSGPDGGPLWW